MKYRIVLLVLFMICNVKHIHAQILELGADTIVCNLNGLTLNADTGFVSYRWSTGDTTPSITVFNSTSYFVEVITAQNDTLTDNISIYFSFPPIADFNFANVGCPGDTVSFFDQSFTFNDPIIAWRWDFGDGGIDSIQSTTHIFNSSGTFLVSLTVTNDRGCDSTITKPVNVFSIPAVNAGSDTLVNVNESFIFNATSTLGNYLWQPNFFLNNDTILNPICSPQNNIRYTLTVIDSNGCVNSDSVFVSVNFAPLAFNKLVNINPNGSAVFSPFELASDENSDSLTFTIITQPSNGTANVVGDTISYSPNLNFAGTDTIVFQVCDNGKPPLCDEGLIIISVGNRAPEASTDSSSSEVNGETSFNVLNNDIEFNTNQKIEIDFISSPENGSVVDLNNGNLIYTPAFGYDGIDSFYYVICDNGQPILCDTAWVYIQMNAVPLFINNAFTPNNDGLFDTFIIEGINNFPKSELLVFNRWGEIIFKATGYNNDWNGFTGFKEEVPEATYFYQLNLNDGSKPFTGYLVLTR